MADRVRQLLNRVLEWWNKFTAKQKTLIISAGAGVILLLVIIITWIGQPQYVDLINCENTKQAAEVVDLLTAQNITYEISDDGLRIRVLVSQQSDANLLLGANEIQSVAYSIDNVTSGGFSTTESDKQKLYQVYLESKLQEDIKNLTAVKNATVQLSIPENTGTLIAANEEASVFIMLELNGDFTSDNAAYLAKGVSVAMGNKTDKNVVIIDSEGNMLFSGDDNYSAAGTASSQLSVRAQAEKYLKNEVRQVLLGTNSYDRIEVAANLDISFSTINSTKHEYYVDDGRSEGYLAHQDTYESESTNGNGDVPGTDANDETPEYQMQDYSESSSTVSEQSSDYLPNEQIIDETTLPGAINYGASTITVTAIKYNIVKEEDVKAQGLLDGITWEEYQAANKGQKVQEVDAAIYEVVSKATGMPVESIAIWAAEENLFYPAEGPDISFADVVQVVLIVLILGLLAFVVLRSMRTEKEEVQEEELSVETLLQSQPAEDLENIDLDEGSEARRIIEKFVEDNPEAAANLLRNWLTEGW